MYLLIKCIIFTIYMYANNLLESIKILYKLNNLVASLVAIYSIGILGGGGIATLTGIFWGMQKIVGVVLG